MKNYFFDKNSRNFIETFSIQKTGAGNKIVLYLGSGEKYVIPYSEANIKRIELLMKSQFEIGVNKINSFKASRNKSKFRGKFFLILSIIMAVITTFGVPISGYILQNVYHLQTLGISLSVVAEFIIMGFLIKKSFDNSTKNFLEAQKYDLILDDILKHDIFFEIEKELQFLLDNDNKNVMLDLSSEMKEKIKPKNSKADSEKISLPLIHDMSLEDLELLKQNIERIEFFRFEGDSSRHTLSSSAEDIKEQIKPKTMVMKPKDEDVSRAYRG